MTEQEQKSVAKHFAEYWKDKGYEKGQSQAFWLSLLRDVYGVEHPEEYITFEDQVHLDHTSFIDGYIPSTRVMIEQKGLGKDLNAPIKQSDGSLLTPFQQAKRYCMELPVNEHPLYVITCNFGTFQVYDMNKPQGEPEVIQLKDLEKEYYRLEFLVNKQDTHIQKELEISVQAGDIVGKLYDAFHVQYPDPDSEESLHSLNVLCVRLVFCLYAENGGIFGGHTKFYDYLSKFDSHQIRKALIELFHVLDTPEDERDPFIASDDEVLASFPYVNGGLFSDENITIPPFTDEIKTLLLEQASAGFDWSGISPTIFGAVFESTLNPETRRSGGMHYTSVENIHKVIDPLFLNDLTTEFKEIQQVAVERTRKKKLQDFQKKLASLTFLDPACGSGNFLTETYLSLRRLENEVVSELTHGQITLGDIDFTPIMVSLNQFYGIEINDFAISVARTALWIAEAQMMQETEQIVHQDLNFLPLKSYTNIVEGNALKIDWNDVVPNYKTNYIMGNPPFVGAKKMNEEQKKEAVAIYGKGKLVNSLDYVGAWYYKSAEFMQGTNIRTALVATNSITQGEQVAPLWEKLFNLYHIHIDFAYRTFRWDSESNLKAHVHCVIIGFSIVPHMGEYVLYDNNKAKKVNRINAYLVDAPDVFISHRAKPICDVPPMVYGNMPCDGGNFILTKKERDEILKKDKSIEPCIRRFVSARDFINNNEIRYCLWLKDISPSIYKKNTEIMKRIESVREMRLNSHAEPTRKAAEKPYCFFFVSHPDSKYIVVPRVSSERRKYIPIGFETPDIIVSDSVQIIADSSIYIFGVLTSNIHNAWMRAIGGRLKSDYRYSGGVVYNNFPWPDPTPEQKAKIKQTAQAILDARALYPDSSLADLYDELTMPPELRKAHQDNDRAVMQAYGFSVKDMTESMCVAELMKMYQKLVETHYEKHS